MRSSKKTDRAAQRAARSEHISSSMPRLLLDLHVEAGRIEGLDKLAGVEIAGDFETFSLGLCGIPFDAFDFLDRFLEGLAAHAAAIVGTRDGQALDLAFGCAAFVLDGQVLVARVAVEAARGQGVESFLGGL